MSDLPSPIAAYYQTQKLLSDQDTAHTQQLGGLATILQHLQQTQELSQTAPLRRQLLEAQANKLKSDAALTSQLGNLNLSEASPEVLRTIALKYGTHPGAATLFNLADKAEQRRQEQRGRATTRQLITEGGPTFGPVDPSAAVSGVVTNPGGAAGAPPAGISPEDWAKKPAELPPALWERMLKSQGQGIDVRAPNPANMVTSMLDAKIPASNINQLLRPAAAPAQQQGFTLAPNATRYDPAGNVVATAPAAPPRTATAAQGGDTLLTPGAVDMRASQLISGEKGALANLGRGVQGTEDVRKINNRAAEILAERGGTPQEIGRRIAEFKANSASLQALTKQYDAVTAFEQTAVRNGEMLKELAQKVDTTGVPAIERWIRAGRQNIAGDEDVAKFMAQLQVYRTEAAKVLTNPNLTGQLTDSARKEVESFMGPGANAKQIVGVVDLLRRDFGNRKQTMEGQINSVRDRIQKNVGPGEQTKSGNDWVERAMNANPGMSVTDVITEGKRLNKLPQDYKP